MLTQVQQPYLGFESTEIINSMQRKLQCCTLCLLGYKKLLWLIQSISYLQKTLVLAEVPTWGLRYQGWQTYGTHSQNGTQKDFHGARHSLLSQFSLISLPDQRVYILKNTCIYTHTYLTVYTLYMNYRYYQITLQVKHFYIIREPCEELMGDWADTWLWTKRFTVVFWNKNYYLPQLFPRVLPYRISPGGVYCYKYNDFTGAFIV